LKRAVSPAIAMVIAHAWLSQAAASAKNQTIAATPYRKTWNSVPEAETHIRLPLSPKSQASLTLQYRAGSR